MKKNCSLELIGQILKLKFKICIMFSFCDIPSLFTDFMVQLVFTRNKKKLNKLK